MRDAPIEKAIAAGVEEAEGEAEEPKRRVAESPEQDIRERMALHRGRRERRRIRMETWKSVFPSVGRFAEEDEHHDAGEGKEGGGNIKSALPTEQVGGLARDDIGEAERDLIAGADDAYGMAAAENGHPVGGDAHTGSPAERLTKAIGCPDEEQKVKTFAQTEEHVERGGAKHAAGEHDAGR
jgi:hypothetical protein